MKLGLLAAPSPETALYRVDVVVVDRLLETNGVLGGCPSAH